jgi:uncharacterized membrane protein YedE/YeeE
MGPEDAFAHSPGAGKALAAHHKSWPAFPCAAVPAHHTFGKIPQGLRAMQNFAPLSATVGGLLIGLSATLLWVFNGRTAGISNIAGGVYPVRQGDVLWRVLFLAGLPLGAWLGFLIAPSIFAELPATLPVVELQPLWLVVAGLLVGVGTRVGRGCTSGHGICGLSRLSVRSLVAVLTFMATAAVTVFIVRHVLA